MERTNEKATSTDFVVPQHPIRNAPNCPPSTSSIINTSSKNHPLADGRHIVRSAPSTILKDHHHRNPFTDKNTERVTLYDIPKCTLPRYLFNFLKNFQN